MSINTSFMYHAFGVRNMECTSITYKGRAIFCNIQTRLDKLCCPKCKSRNIVRNGTVERDIRSVPIGSKAIFLHMRVQRIKCRNCGCDCQEKVHFTTGKQTYTHRLARFVICLLKMGTVQDAANFLGMSWATIKDIHKNYLKNNYAHPDIGKVENIGIDEFAVKKGHKYKTIVVDLDTGHIIYVGDGKGADSLDKFWEKARRQGAQIKYIATDLSAAFIKAVHENAPDAVHVFDHFHVKKVVVDYVDKVRKSLYDENDGSANDKRANKEANKKTKDKKKRNFVKGLRWLVLSNGKNLDENGKAKLEEALKKNKPLYAAYYLKEEIDEVWKQTSKKEARNVLYNWVRKAIRCEVTQMVKAGISMFKHREGILAWYDYGISTAIVEGTNNKIKVMKRDAYGFRDDKYFELRLLSIHDAHITAFLR